MEPFQLICSSCAAKLKVQRESAIGQRLACPRCGQMILVQPPAGHELADVGETSGGSASMNFDDMDLDAILENNSAKKPASKPGSKSDQRRPAAKPKTSSTSRLDLPTPKQTRPAKPRRQTSADAASARIDDVPKPVPQVTNRTPATKRVIPATPTATAEPLVPGEQWVNPATRKKQRTLIFLGIGIVSLLSLAIGGYAVVSLRTSETGTDSAQQVAVVEPDPVLAGDDRAANDDAANDDAANDDVEPNQGDTAQQAIDAPPDSTLPDAPVVDASPPEIKFDAPMIGAETKPDSDSDPEFPPPIETDSASDLSIDVPSPDATIGGERESEMADALPAEIDAKREIEAIREILEQNGTSLSKVRSEAAATPYRGKVGLPKYVFEKSDFKAVDFQKQKNMLLPGVSYKALPLQAALHELAKISGLVLAIDVPSLTASGAMLNPEVTLTLKDQDVSMVAGAIAESVGLRALETDDGFLFTVPDVDQVDSSEIDVSDLVNADATGEQCVQLVTAMVFPNGWLLPGDDESVDGTGGKGTIEFQRGNLVVTHQAVVVREVQKLVDAIRELKSGDEFTSTMLQHVVSLSDGQFAKPYAAKRTVRPALGQFLSELQSESSVLAIADWSALAPAGWTPDSMASAWIDEPTVGDVIEEFAHAIGAAYYVVDEQTVWLTSWEKASNMFEVKLHSTAEIAGGKLNSRQLSRLLSDALGPQTRQPGVAIRLFDNGKVLAVRAPQAVQRQVRSVLQTLK